MLGTIIFIHNHTVTIATAQGLYKSNYEQIQELREGFCCEFTELKKPALWRCGLAQIEQISSTALISNDFAISKNLKIEDHEIKQLQDDPLIVGEGCDLEQAYLKAKQLAQQYNANALLDFKAQIKVKQLVGKALFIVSGKPALIEGPLFTSQAQGLKLPSLNSRPNSPNLAQARYIKVLSVCLSFILVPCGSAFIARLQLPLWTFILLLGLAIAAMAAAFLFYMPRKTTAYLLQAIKRDSI